MDTVKNKMVTKLTEKPKKKATPRRTRIVISTGDTDLRKGVYSIGELCGIKPHQKKKSNRTIRLAFFVFCNKHKNRIKIFVKSDKCHLIHENHVIKDTYFWWPSTRAELKKNEKTIRKYIVDILTSYGFTNVI